MRARTDVSPLPWRASSSAARLRHAAHGLDLDQHAVEQEPAGHDRGACRVWRCEQLSPHLLEGVVERRVGQNTVIFTIVSSDAPPAWRLRSTFTKAWRIWASGSSLTTVPSSPKPPWPAVKTSSPPVSTDCAYWYPAAHGNGLGRARLVTRRILVRAVGDADHVVAHRAGGPGRPERRHQRVDAERVELGSGAALDLADGGW